MTSNVEDLAERADLARFGYNQVVIGCLVHMRLRTRTTTLEASGPAPFPVVEAA